MSSKQTRIKKNWSLLVEGERQGLYECFDIFHDDLYRFGLSLYKDQELIKESIQNLFIELWQMRDKLSEVTNIQQYIFTIYKRIIYKAYNDKFRQNCDPSISIENIDERLLVQNSYETILVNNQTNEHKKQKLLQALEKLSPRQKQIIQLRYFEGVSFQEIAQITSLSERTVYNTLHNAIKTLRETLVSSIMILFRIQLP
ncbi:sigma-70 family RNA polymerase sigma factor [Solitalea sp. MAHUQ-68]|uniref:Sigma-70 family RNA polymerase sigma factor n=1 Tax=Solitalea agri TaxID=2953739 RepID=A0A9X2F3W5_9SPHI|nr:sigma-70 family RNA polymerase sigma factor [Solitalea agri]MCO4294299.1 sigma-70 family RNA polymerase sigma factor [Solitalea agri]